MKSIWEQETVLPQFAPLHKDVETEVLIIGGGLAGLLCAYFLQQAGIDYMVVEKDRVFGGVSGKTTAKITAQHGLIYHKLLRHFGKEKAKLYLEANLAALRRYEALSSRFDYVFEKQDSYVYSLDRWDKLVKELAALRLLDYPAELKRAIPLPVPHCGAVRFPEQAQCDPLKLAVGLLQGLTVYEQTPICSYDGNAFLTKQHRIRAKKTIVTTHFPFLNKHGAYFLKLYQHRSYVLALENAENVDGMYVDENEKGLSFRNYGDLLLLGGGSHRTGKPGGGWEELEDFARIRYPNATVRASWATQDCMPLDHMPYIGSYSKNTPDLLVATGFQKWGMTSSMVAAELLCGIIKGEPSPYVNLFSPSRGILRPQLAVNAAHSVVNLLTPTRPRCPHMGCALKWNPQEHSWDCPCHGSRFSETGELLDNPAEGDLP